MKKAVFNIVLLSILWAGVSGAEMRTWTSKNGDTIEAEYVQMFGSSKVILKTAAGKTLKIPVAGLSAADWEYLAATVPPKIDIEVDVDKDQHKESARVPYYQDPNSPGANSRNSDFQEAKIRETIKCSVSVKKTNKDPCNREFRAYMYVFAQQVRGDTHWLISCASHPLSFKDDGNVFCFKSPPASVERMDKTYADNHGFQYKGYIAVVEDSAGNVVAMKSTRNLYEKNWGKIRGASKGARFDREFDLVGNSQDSWSTGSL